MMKTIYLAGGCFWGLQKFMDQFDGIVSTTVGYANGKTETTTYELVKSQISDHSETVKVVYDSSVISLKEILEKFYLVIDPTSINKQGEDERRSYRTGIYYEDQSDTTIINEVTQLEQMHHDKKIVVEIEPIRNFCEAEEYHQKYLEKNPDGYCHIGGCFFG
ncbi:MAG: peptide-methionine (S)-S-oxide reductase MsrA [Clostridia bacterium]